MFRGSLFFYLHLPFWSEVVICPVLGGQHRIHSPCTYSLRPVSSLLATLMVETGVAVNREPTGFGKTESVRSKWANKTIECFCMWEQLRVTWDILGWCSVRKNAIPSWFCKSPQKRIHMKVSSHKIYPLYGVCIFNAVLCMHLVENKCPCFKVFFSFLHYAGVLMVEGEEARMPGPSSCWSKPQ